MKSSLEISPSQGGHDIYDTFSEKEGPSVQTTEALLNTPVPDQTNVHQPDV